MHRSVPAAAAAILAVLVVAVTGCSTHREPATEPGRASTPGLTTAVATAEPSSATIGTLSERTSIRVHGTARLDPLEPGMEEDLRTLAEDTKQDPDDVIRGYRAQPAFDRVVAIAQQAEAGYADAVFRPGPDAASELRFVTRPPADLVARLTGAYPRDLLLSWGERLAGDRDRDRLSGTVFDIVHRLPRTGSAITGIDADGRLTVEYDGTAALEEVAAGIERAPAFRRLFVDGRPPSEVRVTKVADASASFG